LAIYRCYPLLSRFPAVLPRVVSNNINVSSPRLLIAIAIALAGAIPASTQAPKPQSRPSFEVASVRANTSPDPHGHIGPDGGHRFTAVNQTVRALVRVAYGLHDFQILGGPKWLDTDRFDVLAVTLGSPRDFPLMLQSLLEERFNLRFHKEAREFPIFALVIARPNSPGLRKSSVDCGRVMMGALEEGRPLPSVKVCGGQNPPGRLTAGGFTMANLALHLSRIVGRHVVDRTGLPGGFDFDLKWAPIPVLGPSVPDDRLAMTDGPSIYTALQEQLGLKLERARGPIEVLIIDRVEHPPPD